LSSDNGKPLLHPGILTPNDLKRVKVAAGGQSPQELMAEVEGLWQVLMFAVKSRTDPEFTWEQAGDTPLGEVFDMTSDGGPPPTPPPARNGSEPTTPAANASTPKRRSAGPAPSSASSST
jgi:hypothetical protein